MYNFTPFIIDDQDTLGAQAFRVFCYIEKQRRVIMARHKRLVIAICVVAAMTIAAAAYLFATTPREYEAVSNIVYVNDDGTAQIKVDNINKIIMTHEDVELAGKTLRAGTIIIPGSGDEIYYNYPRKDAVKGDN